MQDTYREVLENPGSHMKAADIISMGSAPGSWQTQYISRSLEEQGHISR